MFKRALRYGLVLSAFLAGVFALIVGLGGQPFLDPKQLLIDGVLFAIFIAFAMREFKALDNDGYLHFWQGMTIGFMVYGISIVAFTAFLGLYFLLDENFMTSYQQAAMNYYESKRMLFEEEFGVEMYNKALEEVRNDTPGELIGGAAIKKVFAAFLVTPVISLFLRKKPK